MESEKRSSRKRARPTPEATVKYGGLTAHGVATTAAAAPPNIKRPDGPPKMESKGSGKKERRRKRRKTSLPETASACEPALCRAGKGPSPPCPKRVAPALWSRIGMRKPERPDRDDTSQCESRTERLPQARSARSRSSADAGSDSTPRRDSAASSPSSPADGTNDGRTRSLSRSARKHAGEDESQADGINLPGRESRRGIRGKGEQSADSVIDEAMEEVSSESDCEEKVYAGGEAHKGDGDGGEEGDDTERGKDGGNEGEREGEEEGEEDDDDDHDHNEEDEGEDEEEEEEEDISDEMTKDASQEGRRDTGPQGAKSSSGRKRHDGSHGVPGTHSRDHPNGLPFAKEEHAYNLRAVRACIESAIDDSLADLSFTHAQPSDHWKVEVFAPGHLQPTRPPGSERGAGVDYHVITRFRAVADTGGNDVPRWYEEGPPRPMWDQRHRGAVATVDAEDMYETLAGYLGRGADIEFDDRWSDTWRRIGRGDSWIAAQLDEGRIGPGAGTIVGAGSGFDGGVDIDSLIESRRDLRLLNRMQDEHELREAGRRMSVHVPSPLTSAEVRRMIPRLEHVVRRLMELPMEYRDCGARELLVAATERLSMYRRVRDTECGATSDAFAQGGSSRRCGGIPGTSYSVVMVKKPPKVPGVAGYGGAGEAMASGRDRVYFLAVPDDAIDDRTREMLRTVDLKRDSKRNIRTRRVSGDAKDMAYDTFKEWRGRYRASRGFIMKLMEYHNRDMLSNVYVYTFV